MKKNIGLDIGGSVGFLKKVWNQFLHFINPWIKPNFVKKHMEKFFIRDHAFVPKSHSLYFF